MGEPESSDVKRRQRRLIGRVWSALALAASIAGCLAIATRGDPMAEVFKSWLSTDPATNPISFHQPYRTVDGKMVYISARRTTTVKAAMSGTVRVSEGKILQLSGKDSMQRDVVVSYEGLTSVLQSDGRVKCGQTIGFLERPESQSTAILRVDVKVNQDPLQPPETFALLTKSAEHSQ